MAAAACAHAIDASPPERMALLEQPWGEGRGEACTQSGGERLLALAAAGRPSTQLGGPSALPMGLRARSCDRARDR